MVRFGPHFSEDHLFFREPSSMQRVIGEYLLDGVKTSVVVKAWETRSASDTTWLVQRAYIDVERGALPLRIEIGTSGDLPDVARMVVEPYPHSSDFLPSCVIRDVSIASLKADMFYPIRGIEDSMGPHPDDAGEQKVRRLVPFQTSTWDVRSVECDREMSSEMFELKFPPNTAFHDARTNETRVVGDKEGFSELAINRALQPVKSRTAWLWWGVPSGMSLLVILFVAFRRWTRRAR